MCLRAHFIPFKALVLGSSPSRPTNKFNSLKLFIAATYLNLAGQIELHIRHVGYCVTVPSLAKNASANA